MKPSTPTAKHTAGPWEMPGTDGGEFVICTHNSKGKRRTLAHAYSESDAHLIAAAPDLVAACEAAVSALYEASMDYNQMGFTDRRGAGPRMSAALKAVRLALSKAAGEKGKG